MATTLRHPLIEGYLDRVEAATVDHPWEERDQLLESVHEHLVRRLGLAPTDDEVRDALGPLGPPELLMTGRQQATAPPERLGALEWTAISLLLLGGFLGGVGWLVGVSCLWFSNAWKWHDKLVGMLCWPFGLVTPVLWAMASRLEADPGSAAGALDIVRTIAIFGVPFMTSVYLIIRARA